MVRLQRFIVAVSHMFSCIVSFSRSPRKRKNLVSVESSKRPPGTTNGSSVTQSVCTTRGLAYATTPLSTSMTQKKAHTWKLSTNVVYLECNPHCFVFQQYPEWVFSGLLHPLNDGRHAERRGRQLTTSRKLKRELEQFFASGENRRRDSRQK